MRRVAVNAREILAAIPFFAEVLTETELDQLADNAYELTAGPGTTIIRENDVGSSMIIITDGMVSVSLGNRKGKRTVATLGKGEFVGEMSLMTGAPRTATVTVESPLTALEIDRSAIQPLLAGNPRLFDRFAEILEKRRRELDKLYGPGVWPFSEPRHSDLAVVIRTYFMAPTARA
jgi:CRP-like cAMP-binding protein